VKKWILRMLGMTVPVIVVRHERMARVSEAELRGWLAGQAEEQTVRGAQEIAERLIWTFVEQARAGNAKTWMARVDALREFQEQLAVWTRPEEAAQDAARKTENGRRK
jgi:hypothetical protein